MNRQHDRRNVQHSLKQGEHTHGVTRSCDQHETRGQEESSSLKSKSREHRHPHSDPIKVRVDVRRTMPTAMGECANRGNLLSRLWDLWEEC